MDQAFLGFLNCVSVHDKRLAELKTKVNNKWDDENLDEDYEAFFGSDDEVPETELDRAEHELHELEKKKKNLISSCHFTPVDDAKNLISAQHVLELNEFLIHAAKFHKDQLNMVLERLKAFIFPLSSVAAKLKTIGKGDFKTVYGLVAVDPDLQTKLKSACGVVIGARLQRVSLDCVAAYLYTSVLLQGFVQPAALAEFSVIKVKQTMPMFTFECLYDAHPASVVVSDDHYYRNLIFLSLQYVTAVYLALIHYKTEWFVPKNFMLRRHTGGKRYSFTHVARLLGFEQIDLDVENQDELVCLIDICDQSVLITDEPPKFSDRREVPYTNTFLGMAEGNHTGSRSLNLSLARDVVRHAGFEREFKTEPNDSGKTLLSSQAFQIVKEKKENYEHDFFLLSVRALLKQSKFPWLTLAPESKPPLLSDFQTNFFNDVTIRTHAMLDTMLH